MNIIAQTGIWLMYGGDAMLGFIWGGIMLLSVLFGIVNHRIQQVSDAVFSGGAQAVQLGIALLATMCIWSGLMRIADKAGITSLLSKALRPFLRLVMPELNPRGDAARAISLAISANVLGLGNAATPLGIAAMKELHKEAGGGESASRSMRTFVVISSASVTLIPTTVGAMRARYGAAHPLDIMPLVWAVSAGALILALLADAAFNIAHRRRQR